MPPRVPRVNGWSPPLHPFQIMAWAMFLALAVATFLIFIPLLPHVWKVTANSVSFPGPPAGGGTSGDGAAAGVVSSPSAHPVHPLVAEPAPHTPPLLGSPCAREVQPSTRERPPLACLPLCRDSAPAATVT